MILIGISYCKIPNLSLSKQNASYNKLSLGEQANLPIRPIFGPFVDQSWIRFPNKLHALISHALPRISAHPLGYYMKQAPFWNKHAPPLGIQGECDDLHIIFVYNLEDDEKMDIFSTSTPIHQCKVYNGTTVGLINDHCSSE